MTKKSATKNTAKKRAVKKKTAKKSPVKKSAVKKKSVKKSQKLTKKKSAKAMASNEIELKSVLAVSDASVLYAELGQKLGETKDILINASRVEMVDTAILQLLLAFIKKSQSQNVAVEWVKPSQEFLSRSETLNLTGMLGLGEK
jgi:anti-anti-sigma regulatory factor